MTREPVRSKLMTAVILVDPPPAVPLEPQRTTGPQRHSHRVRHFVDAILQAPPRLRVKHNFLGI
jgi:hypothetical protein